MQKNYKDNWKNDHRKGGGGLSNYISHIFSYLLNNFGSIALINSNLNHKHIANFIFDDSSGKISFKHSNKISGSIEFDIFSSENSAFIFEVRTKKHIYKISNNLRDFFIKFDLFRDEDMEFAQRLIKAGVTTEFHLYPGAFHASEILAPDAALSKRIWEVRYSALKRALYP